MRFKAIVTMLATASFLLVVSGSIAQEKKFAKDPKAMLESDWAQLAKYRDANAKLPPPAADEDRVVFLGDSITENWANSFKKAFPGKPYIGRGISSQTSQQMLIRFRPDVIELKPKVVVILAGTNDVAGNTGRQSQEIIAGHIMTMVDLAEANNIRTVLLSTLPASDFWWQKGMEPAEKIVALNAWMKDYAAKRGVVFVDIHTPLKDEKNGLQKQYSGDGVHPNAAGYAVMNKLAEEGIALALKKK